MGYISSVAFQIECTHEGAELLMNRALAEIEGFSENQASIKKHVTDDLTTLYFYRPEIKWRFDAPYVNCLYDFYILAAWMCTEDPCTIFGTYFVRTGEDMNDCEVHFEEDLGHPYFYPMLTINTAEMPT